MPRQPHEATDQLRNAVAEMMAIGLQQKQVCKLLGLDAKTLKEHCRREIEHGHAKIVVEVGQSLIAKALEGNVKAAELIMRARAGWTVDGGTTVSVVPKRQRKF